MIARRWSTYPLARYCSSLTCAIQTTSPVLISSIGPPQRCTRPGPADTINVRLIRAAIDGAGLAFMLEAHAAPWLARGALVLQDWCPPFAGNFLYYPSRRQQPAALTALSRV